MTQYIHHAVSIRLNKTISTANLKPYYACPSETIVLKQVSSRC